MHKNNHMALVKIQEFQPVSEQQVDFVVQKIYSIL